MLIIFLSVLEHLIWKIENIHSMERNMQSKWSFGKKRSYNIETLGKCVQRIVEITDDGMISTYFYFPKYTS